MQPSELVKLPQKLCKRDHDMPQEVTFTTPDSITVFGTLHEVQDAEVMAVLLHGITTDRNEYLNFYDVLAAKLADQNISSLRFDFRGHGASGEAQKTFSPIGQVLDLVGATNFLHGLDDSHKRKLVAFGTSFGAGPAIFLSKLMPQVFSRIYLLAPVLDYKMTFLEPRTNWAQEYFTPEAITAAFKCGFLKLDEFDVGLRAIIEMGLLSPASVAADIAPLRIRVVHGDADSMVPINQSEELYRSASNVSFLKMPGMDHGYNAAGDDDGSTQQSAQNRLEIVEDFIRFAKGTDA